jgi:hypothetical protein
LFALAEKVDDVLACVLAQGFGFVALQVLEVAVLREILVFCYGQLSAWHGVYPLFSVFVFRGF